MGVSRDCPIFWVPPIISGTDKATDFKFGGYIYRANPNKSSLILEKRERGRIQGLFQIFWVPPVNPGTVKATHFKFGGYIYRANPNRRPLKFWRKGSVGVSRDCPIFLGTPYYLRNG